jgi:hypothetical protein
LSLSLSLSLEKNKIKSPALPPELPQDKLLVFSNEFDYVK